jgi:hypothetical protein
MAILGERQRQWLERRRGGSGQIKSWRDDLFLSVREAGFLFVTMIGSLCTFHRLARYVLLCVLSRVALGCFIYRSGNHGELEYDINNVVIVLLVRGGARC